MSNLYVIYERLVQAKAPEDIFAPIAGNDKDEKLENLKNLYHYLVKFVHPDKCSDAKDKYMANEATAILTTLHDEAVEKIKNGTFGEISSSSSKGSILYEFEMKGRKFKVFTKLDESDICNIFSGECEHRDGKVETVIFKIPFDDSNNDLMRNEAEVLKKVSHKSSTVLVESCELKDNGVVVNVLKSLEGSYTFEQIRAKYKDGLPQLHVAWVLDRLLSVLGFFHINKVIHGGIKPGNILVVPSNHNAVLSDFSLSIIDADEPDKTYKGKNLYSAPEITEDSVPNPVTDMFSLGKSIIYLAGGEVDKKIVPPSSMDKRFREFLERMVHTDPSLRSSDAWAEWHKLKKLRKDVVALNGVFVKLDM